MRRRKNDAVARRIVSANGPPAYGCQDGGRSRQETATSDKGEEIRAAVAGRVG